MTDLRKAAEQALEKISKAHEKVSALCSGDERWTMSVPVRQDHDHDVVISDALRASEAVIRAALAQPDVPEGYVLVPVEPTHEMCDQGAQAIVQWENGCVWPDSWGDTYAKQYRKDAKKAYSAMLAAAPKGTTK